MRKFIVVGILSMFSVPAIAQTTIGQWTMGDDDSGASNSSSVNSTLTASVGSDLTLSGSGLTYTDTISPQTSGSLAVDFDGSGNYATASNLGLSKNFAIETWVRFSDLSNTQWVILVGHGSSSGAGILMDSGTGRLTGARSGAGTFAGSNISVDTWYHVAMVVDDSDIASLYFNGSLLGGNQNLVGFASSFSLGGDENGSARFEGIIDDAKVFTFSAGTFSTSMLSYSAVPEPATWTVFVGFAALGFAASRRRRA